MPVLPFGRMSRPFYTHVQQQRVLQVIPDLIRSRELLFNLVWKDLRVRYRYAAIGFLWAILEPLLMCLVLTFVFSIVFRLRSVDPTIDSPWDFAALLLTALIPWQFFASSLSNSTRSLVYYHDLVAKTSFPRELVPLSAVGVSLFNLLIGFTILLGLLTAFGKPPGAALLWLPIVFAIQFVLVAGLALLLSCLHVYYRDIGYMVDVGLMFGFYATPIFYTLWTVQAGLENRLPDFLPWLYYAYFANPMVGLVTAYREALVYNRPPGPSLLLWPAIVAALCLICGTFVFRRRAGNISDFL